MLTATQVSCESFQSDSDENADGSVAWTPTHRIKPAAYHKLITRYSHNASAVSLDFLLYEPRQVPRGLIVLLSGGALNADLKSTDTKTVSRSGANFLIRSAHYFAARGYRVIGMNRPDDYRTYGNIDAEPALYDRYRDSMAHAVDIAMLTRQHRIANAPVIFIGSSRGAISAFTQQGLANAIVLASPVTSGSGTPLVPSTNTVKMVSRPVVMLMHHADTCPASAPANTLQLAQTLYQNGRRLALFEISGGIRDSASDDPCAALDHHGFAGIEACTVNTAIDAVEKLLAILPGDNHPPVTTDVSIAVTEPTLRFKLHAHDPDTEDVLRYHLPTRQSVLGGKILLDSHSGQITYERPANLHGVKDRFAYSVGDGAGGVTVGIVTLELL